MSPELLTFQKFNDRQLAQDMADVLADGGIEYLLEKSPVTFDPAFRSRTEASDEFLLKIAGTDFEKATGIVNDYEKQFVNDAPTDHYLFSFTNDELLDLVAKRDEWSSFDYELARKILADRGVVITEHQDTEFQEKRIEELKQHAEIPGWHMAVGYLLACLGGAFGLIFGLYIISSKTTLPNGEVFYQYNDKDRQHGRIMIGIAIVVIIILITQKAIQPY
ncbi:hypothetical protein C8P68_102209 [Mucilaginibacter yixingensis]|uniref:Signal transducing protein n=1 Tax=Mucilaginibacter yixingensis TaxID=1295612 RepID=A0A2T5JCA1_9SPHI|nr:hypothetical protein [Mucilaginibacter yixingensis]PTQ99388.1 hypothetical protein C8P68_102209 [Mucilaginibacter yixingensis]